MSIEPTLNTTIPNLNGKIDDNLDFDNQCGNSNSGIEL